MNRALEWLTCSADTGRGQSVIGCSELGMAGVQARRCKAASILAISGLFGGFGLCLNYTQTTHKDPHGTTQNRIGDTEKDQREI
jgi:hypothetical protein